MVKLANTHGSGPCGREPLGVQIPPSASTDRVKAKLTLCCYRERIWECSCRAIALRNVGATFMAPNLPIGVRLSNPKKRAREAVSAPGPKDRVNLVDFSSMSYLVDFNNLFTFQNLINNSVIPNTIRHFALVFTF